MIVKQSSLEGIIFDGLTIYDYTAGSSLESSVALIHVPNGTGHPNAWSRRSDKYYLVVEGEIQFVLRGAESVLAKGDFCYVKQGDHFSYHNSTQKPATLVLMHTPSFDLSAEVFGED